MEIPVDRACTGVGSSSIRVENLPATVRDAFPSVLHRVTDKHPIEEPDCSVLERVTAFPAD